MTWHDLLPVAVFFVTFIASVLSGIVGGGGSFIIMPFYILVGLTPQQAVATNKFGAFGIGAGSVIAFRRRMLEDKRLSIFIIILSVITGIAGSLVLRKIDNTVLQRLIGIFMLAMVPVVLRRTNANVAKPAKKSEVVGTIILIFLMLLDSVLSAGIGVLVSATLMLFFGKSALEANILKRKNSIVLNTVVVIALLGSGFINFTYGFFAIAGGLFGGYVGSQIAVKKGDEFVKYALLAFMALSGGWLLLTAK
jgi:uncharacterized membrane protein YfcA